MITTKITSRRDAGLAALLSCLFWTAALAPSTTGAAPLRFEVGVKPGLIAGTQNGRLFVILARTNSPEPRLTVGRAGRDAPITLARDLRDFGAGAKARLDTHASCFPITNLSALPAGNYFAQALLENNSDLRLANGPGNLYSAPERVHLDPARGGVVRLKLTGQLPPEELPQDTEQVKFIKLPSPLLTQFHHRPMCLRAGVLLPRDYGRDPARRYPLWVRIGGLGARFTGVRRMLEDNREFRSVWLAEETPRFILLQLDGAGPYGDPYYVNSANNGPYGDALTRELIPYIETQFRAIGQPRARVLSGSSTGGWVALGVQVFYPDCFNGAWAFCPDPVDFRALELVNIYADTNAYVNAYGNERPSERNLKGDVTLTLRREVGSENLLGAGNCFNLSGEQWGAWNAVFGPRGADGLPVPLWDPQTGAINHAVAEQWKPYDLRLVLEQNWKRLGPKLRGKLHVAAGEADAFFLNNAVHLLDDFLAHADPPFEGKIIYGPGKGHGWMDLTLAQMLVEMRAATER